MANTTETDSINNEGDTTDAVVEDNVEVSSDDSNGEVIDAQVNTSTAELDEAKTYTKDEFNSLLTEAVKKEVETKISTRIGREVAKTKAAEESLASLQTEFDSLKTSSSSLTEEFKKNESEALLFKIAYETKTESSALEELRTALSVLKGANEDETRANVAAAQKAFAIKKTSSDFNELFDGKDYTKPPAKQSFEDGIFG